MKSAYCNPFDFLIFTAFSPGGMRVALICDEKKDDLLLITLTHNLQQGAHSMSVCVLFQHPLRPLPTCARVDIPERQRHLSFGLQGTQTPAFVKSQVVDT